MIEGLQIDISSEELKVHLAERAKYHRERAEWYNAQATSLRDGLRITHVTNDPVISLEDSTKRHQDNSAYFSFMAEHIIEDEIYRLPQDDLGRIELASRYFPGAHF